MLLVNIIEYTLQPGATRISFHWSFHSFCGTLDAFNGTLMSPTHDEFKLGCAAACRPLVDCDGVGGAPCGRLCVHAFSCEARPVPEVHCFGQKWHGYV